MTVFDRLALLASPTFALMAIFSAEQSAQPGPLLCGALLSASPLSGMTVMYALMSVFHATPWLKVVTPRSPRPHVVADNLRYGSSTRL